MSANITTTSTTRTDFDLATTPGGPVQLISGPPATFTVVSDNNGPATASNVTQTIQLPLTGGAYPVTGDVTVTGGTYNTTTGRLTFTTVASLPNDGVLNNSVTYVPRTVGSYTLTGAATASGTDLTTANNSQNLSITVNSLAGVGSSPGPGVNPGRDGLPTALTSNPNIYFPSGSTAQTVSAGSNSSSLGTARGAGPAIAADDLVLIIQMQGAAINSSNNSYGDGVAGGSGPAQNPTNALPAGTALNPTTDQIFVSNASLLPRINAATTYYVNVITTDLNGGTNVALAQFTLGAYPLPVTLVSFTAQAKGRDAQLAWTTAQELNNDHFDVERSLDGATFAKVGQLAGHGSTSSASSYAFTDASIGSRATGPVYYRLRQVDTDGPATYSPVRTVAFAASATPAISLYPNPAAQATQLDLSLLPAGTYQVQVLDLAGRVVLRQSAAGATAPRLDLSPLASGSYLVQVQGEGLNLAKRLTKE